MAIVLNHGNLLTNLHRKVLFFYLKIKYCIKFIKNENN